MSSVSAIVLNYQFQLIPGNGTYVMDNNLALLFLSGKIAAIPGLALFLSCKCIQILFHCILVIS